MGLWVLAVQVQDGCEVNSLLNVIPADRWFYNFERKEEIMSSLRKTITHAMALTVSCSMSFEVSV